VGIAKKERQGEESAGVGGEGGWVVGGGGGLGCVWGRVREGRERGFEEGEGVVCV